MNIKQYIKANGCTEEEAQGLLKADPCALCYLNKNPYGKDVKGWGSTTPTFMVVSDYIRKGWISTGFKPFCGPLYTLLNKMMTEVGIDQKDVYYTSLVKCPTATSLKKGEDGKLKKEAVDYCSCKLEQEITQLKPKVIIACGQDALSHFFPTYKMAEKRCQILNDPKHNCVIVPIYNPESMTVTSEYDEIISKAFQQASNYIYKPELVKSPEVKYRAITSLELLREVAKRVKDVPRIAYDIETNGVVYHKAKILSIGISWAKNTGIAYPLWIKDEQACEALLSNLKGAERTKVLTQIDHNPPLKKFWKEDEWEEVIKITKDIFENTTCKKGGHNTFFDNLVMHYNGIEVNNYCYDTMIMKHLLDEESEKSLDYCSWIYTDKGGYKMEKEQYLKSEQSNYANIPLDVLLKYNAGDAAVTFEIYDVFKPQIINQDLAFELAKIRIPLQKVLMKACIRGMKVDVDYVRKTRAELEQGMKDIENQLTLTIQKFYGEDKYVTSSKDDKDSKAWNINSAANLRDLFYDKLKCKVKATTSTGAASTDESSLLRLSRSGIKEADLILKHKKMFKSKNTYLDGIEDLLDKDHRVHSSFNVCGTVSGRITSSNPNLQQIPQDKLIKNIFVAEEGYEIGECDFSQAELRVLAALSKDNTMLRIYQQDRDLHSELASTAFRKPIDQITKKERKIAKILNFLIGYAGGPDTLRNNLIDAGETISKPEAERLIKAWHDKFKDASTFLNGCNKRFVQSGLLVTPWGRRRRMPRSFADEYLNAAKGREGQNFVIQSSAAELAFMSIIKIAEEVEQYGGQVISTVHDSILIEYPIEQRQNIAKVCKKHTWVTYPELNGMYMKSDFECAHHWGDKKKYDCETDKFVED